MTFVIKMKMFGLIDKLLTQCVL